MPPSAHKLPSFSSCILSLTLSLARLDYLFVCVCWNVLNLCVRDDFRKTYKEENPDSKGGKEVQVFINYCPYSLFLFFVRRFNFEQLILILLFDLQWILGSKGGWWEVEIYDWWSKFLKLLLFWMLLGYFRCGFMNLFLLGPFGF